MSSSVVVTTHGRVATLTLNRPHALNALDRQLMREVVEAATSLDRDRGGGGGGVAAMVFMGSERSFAAGADIAEMSSLSHVDAHTDDLFSEWDTFAAIRTPMIAAVAGYALGGGCELAMMCDLIIAADSAQFGQPEIGLGLTPALGGSQRLTRAIGKYKAMDLILTGRTIGADEAERIGLVSRVVPSEQLPEEAMRIAESIAARSVPVLYAAKELVNTALDVTLQQGVRFERRVFRSGFGFADSAEGMSAFLPRRDPDFTDQ
nr:enoyl-CoA hydratase-related protein [Salinibacterium sp. ZJ450]